MSIRGRIVSWIILCYYFDINYDLKKKPKEKSNANQNNQ